jgi:hypothetical protein
MIIDIYKINNDLCYMPYVKDLNYTGTDDEKQSRLNAAGLINSALENLWNGCYIAMANGNLVLWNRKLDSIWSILGGDQSKGDPTDLAMEKIDKKIYNTGSLNHKKAGFKKLVDKENITISLQYLLLKEKSLFLRRLQNSQGKGTAYHSPDEDDFD